MAKKKERKSTIITKDGKQYYEYKNKKGNIVHRPVDYKRGKRAANSVLIARYQEIIDRATLQIKKYQNKIKNLKKSENAEKYKAVAKSILSMTPEQLEELEQWKKTKGIA